MTRIRYGEQIWQIHDEEWPRWVRLGWVHPDAMVLSERWTKGVWRKADTLEVFHLFRPSARDVSPPPPPDPKVRRHGPYGIFRGPGPSITEWLIVVNTLVAVIPYLKWGSSYSEHLWDYSGHLKETLGAGGVWVLFIPLFLHANFGHLTGNMLTFVFAGAVIEEYWGRLRMLTIYLGSGLTGALLSLAREKDVLSVGASGAILGMYGAGLVFLLRERNHFNESQRYRLKRVQVPFFLLLVVPSILYADFYAHLGGFLGGILLGAVIPPLRDRLPRGQQVVAPPHLSGEPAVNPMNVAIGGQLGGQVGGPMGSPMNGPAGGPMGGPAPRLRVLPRFQETGLDTPPTPIGGDVAGPVLEGPDESSTGGPRG